jgi:hypothetical protein
MSNKLSRPHPVRRLGNEPLHSNGRPLGLTLLDFWRWSSSDLVSNARRGVLAEFIVASALGITLNDVRDEWGAFDLTTPEGITVEVGCFHTKLEPTFLFPYRFSCPQDEGMVCCH